MRYRKIIPFLILIFVSIIPLFALFHSGLPITHDGQDHVARIANFYQSLSEGIIIPRWAGNLNWGYGHPILMFLYPLPSYLTSLFHFLGFSFVDSLKIVFGLSFIFSGVAMYFWAKEFLGEIPGFASAFLYMFAPYRFVDLYVRGAIGEHVAFVFPPLIFYFILKISKKSSPWYLICGGLSMAGLILSHNAISVMFLPLIILYVIYLFFNTKSKFYLLSSIFYLLSLGFSLSAFFWIPAFFEGKYTLRDIVTKGSYVTNFVDFKNFIYSEWNYGGSGQFSVQVGILQWIFTLFSLPVSFSFFKKGNKYYIFSLSLFLIFCLTLFLMIPNSQFIWQKLTIIQKFQFPWRFLSVSVFIASVFGALVVSVFPKKLKIVASIFLVFFILFLNKDYWKPKDYLYKRESFYTSIYDSTTDTGESGPIWSVRFMEKRPKAHLEIIVGEAKIQELKRISTLHSYIIDVFQKTRFRENTLYFPGWNIYVDKKPVKIEFQDPANRGLMTFFVPEGKHFLEVSFKETKLRTLADIISLLSLVFIFIYAILKKLLWQHFP